MEVTDIPGVVAAGAKWQLAWQGADNADGLVGTADGAVLFAQEQPNRVSRLDADDRVSVFLSDTHGAGSLAIDSAGRIIAAQRTCTDPGRQPRAHACAEPTMVGVLAPERERWPTASRASRSAGSTISWSTGEAACTSRRRRVLRRAAGQVTSLGDDIRANGIMLSPDETIVYVTNGVVIVAFDVPADGTVANRRDFARLEAGGSGDGLAIDAAGRLYVTSAPGVQVFSAEELPGRHPDAAQRDQRRVRRR